MPDDISAGWPDFDAFSPRSSSVPSPNTGAAAAHDDGLDYYDPADYASSAYYAYLDSVNYKGDYGRLGNWFRSLFNKGAYGSEYVAHAQDAYNAALEFANTHNAQVRNSRNYYKDLMKAASDAGLNPYYLLAAGRTAGYEVPNLSGSYSSSDVPAGNSARSATGLIGLILGIILKALAK